MDLARRRQNIATELEKKLRDEKHFTWRDPKTKARYEASRQGGQWLVERYDERGFRMWERWLSKNFYEAWVELEEITLDLLSLK